MLTFNSLNVLESDVETACVPDSVEKIQVKKLLGLSINISRAGSSLIPSPTFEYCIIVVNLTVLCSTV